MPTNPTTSTRRRATALLVALLAALALVAGACSDDDSGKGKDDDRSTSTTEKESDSKGSDGKESDGEESEGEEGTEEPQEFGEAMTDLSERLRNAGGDRCELLQIYMGMGTTTSPETPEEVQKAVTFTTDWLIAMAESLPPEQAADAEVLRNTAEQFQEEARSLDYDPEKMAETSPNSFQSQEFQNAMTTVVRGLATECDPEAAGR